MNAFKQAGSRLTRRRPALGSHCPACGDIVPADARWCPSCQFTGRHSLEMFPGSPPPLMPVLDAAGLLKADELRKIEGAGEKLRQRFPQFRWRVCSIVLPPERKLSVFGFWMLNASPLSVGETAEDRAWSVLLLLNAGTGEAAVVPGYSAEPWLSDADWRSLLERMSAAWRAGKPARAVIRFYEGAGRYLDLAWKRRGGRQSRRARA